MPRTAVIADDAPYGAGPYAPAVKAGGFVFLSGIGALHPESHAIQGATIAAPAALKSEEEEAEEAEAEAEIEVAAGEEEAPDGDTEE